MSGNPEFAARLIDELSADDPESAHSMADDVLLANVDPQIADAYRRLMARCRWWACA